VPEAANRSAAADVFEPLYPKILAAVRRHWRLAVSVFLTVLLVAVAVTFVIPKKYESQMEILLTNERPDLIISPSNRSDALSNDTVDEVRVNSEMELLRSSDIMRLVVLRYHLWESHPVADSALKATPSPKMLEKARISLEHDIVIEPVLKTNLIRVSYSSKSPQLSVDVLNTLTDAYLNEHLAVRGSSETYHFFQLQTADAAKKLQVSQDRLARFRQAHPVTIGDQQDLLLRKAFKTKDDLDQTETNLKEELARASFGDRQARAAQARVVTDMKAVPNLQAINQLTTMLINLKNSKTDLSNKFRSDDRIVTVVNEQIQQTERALKKIEEDGGMERSTGINPVKQTAQLEAAKAKLDLIGLKAKSDELKTQLKAENAELQDLDNVGAELSVLTTQVKQDEINYEVDSRKAEEARVEDQLDAQRIANVALVERPVPSYIPAFPKVGLSIAVSLFLAAFAAATAVLGAEIFGQRT
jgi:uncharacterized protein involved in exopolysaccharide biosynthesis